MGRGLARIFDEDPELLGDLSGEIADKLKSSVTVSTLDVPAGAWKPSEELQAEATTGFLVLQGILVRRVEILDSSSSELLGIGDILVPRLTADLASVPQPSSLRVLQAARVAILDDSFQRRTGRYWPVQQMVVQRMMQRTCSAMLQLAASRLRSADDRLLIVLWNLADRWGYWRSGRIVLPMPLTHELLGDLISTNREAVTKRALPRLIESGKVAKGEGGLLELIPPPPSLMETDRLLEEIGSKDMRPNPG